MLLRSVFSRICKIQSSKNFCSIADVNSSLLHSEVTISSAKKAPGEVNVVSYLINSCGLSLEKAISTSKKVHFDSTEKPDAVLNLLNEYGFTKSQIVEFVRKRPLLLVSDPEITILPKIEFLLQSTGISKTDLFRTISRDPTLLTRSLENQLVPVSNYLNDLMGPEKVAKLLRRGSWVFHHTRAERMIPNMDYLRAVGVPSSSIALLLYHHPEVSIRKHDQFKEAVGDVMERGFDPFKAVFVLALHVLSRDSNKALWENCCETYRKWGWSKDDIDTAFKKHPHCMLLSEKKISGVMSLLVTKMGYESRLIAHNPHNLFYSLEKRIIPRCSVVQFLVSKGLVRKDKSLNTILGPAEKYFLDIFVTKYAKELPELYEIYKGKAVIPEV